ncbi:hypothetical protein FOQG_15218 [Fusarium oxysporum f. sp. raphani 54005]|uniref:Uncharacterized protein n=5 Tax=Fusarium oxysporum TaxID=5507 RepID=X0BP86_FUSOX|nr:hypothetical protein FOZG_07061 [Fusarium oxysporum Fo47]EXA00918.1 hypothetical protein FOWG_00984 [Fusarium oxysporum f. sp. lycopersici MN25]EXA47747.1 hypothetical protein FOVG_04760 [Fusarium oxysporum f. sp. pisi HDV247]EXK80279.1 hypothetical protein FOQG_15218 [Fusarium oxysporum f. sp. raphani 54005]EXL59601.1 hypothetical protein FOCG_02784 [Fusarium oxysporum f. sp. radicis-lycopersici 26381]EXL87465.1 hypothetical protein FOPG_01662 [Fusarium oxysporum f. sp. conglutinans race 2
MACARLLFPGPTPAWRFPTAGPRISGSRLHSQCWSRDKRLLTNNKEFITSEGCLPTQTTCYLPLATIKFPFSLMLTEIEGLDVLMYRLVPHQKDVYGAQAVETG